MSGIRRMSDAALSGAAAGAVAGQVPILGINGHFAPSPVPSVPALLGSSGALVLFDGRVPLQRNSCFQESGPTGGQQSNGTDTTFNSVTHHEFNGGHVNEIQLVFFNSNKGGNTTLTITAAVQSSNGSASPYPVTFNGQTSITVPPGAFVKSDPVYVVDQVIASLYPTPSGPPFTKPGFFSGFSHIKVRTHGVVSSGKWDLGYVYGSLAGEGYEAGAGLADKTISGTVATPSVGTAMYGPALVLTTQRLHQPIVAAFGDSIAAGYNDTAGQGGYIERACNGITPPVPYLKMGVGGQRAPMLGTNAGAVPPWKNATQFILGASHAVVESGINNVRNGDTLAAIQEVLWADWIMLTEMGIKVWQATITPNTTSTDSWATTTNQTVTAQEATRTALNDWIRTTPSPLSGYIEVADAVESSRNSGKWKASYTADGLHPNGTGYAAAATPTAATIGAFFVS